MSSQMSSLIREETSSPKTKQQKAENLSKRILEQNSTELSSKLTTEELQAKVESSQQKKTERQEKRKAAQKKASEKKNLQQARALQLLPTESSPRGPPGLLISNSSNV